MDSEEYYYGKPYDYDPDFNGPKRNRSPTDLVCLYIFAGFMLVWGAIGIYALACGNPEIWVSNVNSKDLICDESTPNLLYINIAQCNTSTIFGCKSRQVCLERCPDEPFAFTETGNDYKNVYCVGNKMPRSNSDAKEMIKDNQCTSYYFPSAAVNKKCIPTQLNYTNVLEELKKEHISVLDIEEAVARIKAAATTEEFGEEMLEDFKNAWPILLGGLAIAVIVTIVYILIMRWLAGVMVWASMGAIAVLLIGCIIFSVRQYMYYDELYPSKSIDERSSAKTSLIVLGVIMSILLLIFVAVLVFLRKRILMAIALIKESSKAIGDIISSLFFPIIPSLLQLALFAFGISVAFFLSSIGEMFYELKSFDTSSCICTGKAENYTNGTECLPEIFANNCFKNIITKEPCDFAKCEYGGIRQSVFIWIFHGVNVVAIYWVLFFMTAFMEMVLAGTFVRWYWAHPKSTLEFWTVTNSLMTTICYHLGTIAFGSLIITIIRIIRVILNGIQQKLRESGNAVATIMVSCCECLFNWLEDIMKFINRNAYIVCAMHGEGFCPSTKEATSLVMRNLMRVFVLDNVTDFLLFLSKFLITLGMACVTYTMLEYLTSHTFHYMWIPIVIIVIATYLVATVFFNVYSMAIDTLFICYLEDMERNDGTPDKPYYMPNKLREILEKSE